MATFNVDSLDFSDDEEVRVGSNDDYGFSYDSGNDALEIEDRVNAAIASIPRSVGTDLVGGKFAETVSEGKALADDGNVYDSIQGAVDNASSWVKVGPGDFRESITISTDDFTLRGCGSRTRVTNNPSDDADRTISIESSDVTIRNLTVRKGGSGIEQQPDYSACTVMGVTAKDTVSSAVILRSEDSIIVNCRMVNASGSGIYLWWGSDKNSENAIIKNNVIEDCNIGINTLRQDSIVASNVVRNAVDRGIRIRGADDSIIYGNIISDVENIGILNESSRNCVIAKNRIDNVGTDIEDDGTGTELDSNLTTE